MPDCIVVYDVAVAVEDVVAFQCGSGAASQGVWKLQNKAMPRSTCCRHLCNNATLPTIMQECLPVFVPI